MAELGMDIRNIRSKPLMAELVRKADFIFVMTYGHLDSMLLLFPSAAEKTFLLREFETDLPVMEREVSVPIGQSRETYRECRDQIRAALAPACSIWSCARPTMKTRVTALKKVAIAAGQRRHGTQGTGPFLARPEWLSVRRPGRLQLGGNSPPRREGRRAGAGRQRHHHRPHRLRPEHRRQ